MSEGWTETTLGEVADVIDPHPSHRAPSVDELGIPFIGIGDLRNTGDVDFSKARKVSREILDEHKLRYSRSDYLIGLGRVASIGMVVKLPDDSIDYVVSPTLAVIKAKTILPQFLYISLQGNHMQEQFQKYKKGSTRESVGMQVLRKLSIHVPPMPEQKRIVDLISSVDSYIDALERQAESARKSRSAVLHEMLSARGDGWTETTLGEVADFLNGKAYSKEELLSQGKYRVLRVGNFFSNSNWYWSDLELEPNKYCENGDLLYAWSASFGPRIWTEEKVIYHYHIWKVVEKPGLLNRSYLKYWLEDDVDRMKSAVGTGSIMMHITKGDMEKRQIYVPTLPEQKRIVDLISSMDDGISATEKLICETKQLRSGLLSDLLSGKHEVPESYDKVIGAA